MKTMSLIRRRLLPAVLIALVVMPLDAQETDPSGNYRCDGVSPNGAAYRALVQIARTGDTYLLRWVTPNGVANVGVGVVRHNTLAVAFFGVTAGVIVYQLDGNNPLIGEWTDLQADGTIYKETLTKLAEGERIAFPPRGSAL
jgi:hypothetical protein